LLSGKRTARSVVGNILLNIAAAGGVLCILAVIASIGFDITLIMFKTGSMSPTIPTGSLAVVRQIPASEIKVGDIVTVDRAGQPPITHRVTSVLPADGDKRSITMRGDANPSADPAPYTIDHARIVLASFPGLAYVVVALSNPLILGATTVGATALVAWAFWPRTSGPRKRRAPKKHAATSAGASLLVLAMTLGLTLGLTLGSPSAARAAETETVVQGTYITLTSIGDSELMEHLAPESPVLWQVGVQASPPERSSIDLGISAEGTAADTAGLRLSVSSCTSRWVGALCAGTESEMLPLQNLDTALQPTEPNGARMIGWMDSSFGRWLLVQVQMLPGTPPGSTVGVRIHAWGPGDEIAIGSGALAATGSSPGALTLLAGLAILGGLGLAGIVRRRRAEWEYE
jgi:signal peptidase